MVEPLPAEQLLSRLEQWADTEWVQAFGLGFDRIKLADDCREAARRIVELEQQLAAAARNYFALNTTPEPRAVPAEFPDSDDKTVRCAFCKSPITTAWGEVRGCCVDGAEWDVGRLENSPPTKTAAEPRASHCDCPYQTDCIRCSPPTKEAVK